MSALDEANCDQPGRERGKQMWNCIAMETVERGAVG